MEYFNEIYIKNILETKSLPFMEKFSLQDQRKKREREGETERDRETERSPWNNYLFVQEDLFFDAKVSYSETSQ